ncbi:hypothetical protein PRUPE_3G086600 [Prunus persica]|uniref:Uncharacterized protein n=1 Tax=Prunus persica TaxID=3760 RepID=M5WRQ8_PRUPE|nr:hypothetical protein PRUPE_3G086600 [Prunus persica]
MVMQGIDGYKDLTEIRVHLGFTSGEQLKDQDTTQTNLTLLASLARQGRMFLNLSLSKLEIHEESLCQMEHENVKFLNAKRDLSDENVSSYEKQPKFYEQLHRDVSL